MKVLHLTLIKKWFDLIASGDKRIEYRTFKLHWEQRLVDKSGMMKCFDEIHFRNGYRQDSPFMRVEFLGTIITHSDLCTPVHGEELQGKQFLIIIGSVLELKTH